MSGSYNELDVPPTLVSFCVGTIDTNKVISNEFKKEDSKVVFLETKQDEDSLPDFDDLKENYELIHKLIEDGKALSVSTIKHGGIADAITKMCMGNKIGFEFSSFDKDVFYPYYGSFVIELKEDIQNPKLQVLGKTIQEEQIMINENIKLDLDELIKLWEEPLEKVFPTKVKIEERPLENILSDKKNVLIAKNKIAKPQVFIPVFPGTNCEYDSAKAFEDAGGDVHITVFRNLKPKDIEDSIEEMASQINKAQIIMFPGGFSAGDEPDGSGKFIATVFRNPKIKETVHKHLYEQDGLMLGICNGFQALIKLGLLPYGKIMDMEEKMPTLTYNDIARHQSTVVPTKVVSKLSPWFNEVELGEEFMIPISHGEGKFVAPEEVMKELIQHGQIATQYVDLNGNATYDIRYNPNGSIYAVEGITSPDGRILGKMGHSERSYTDVIKNVPGNKNQRIFESGINYFK